MHALTGKKSFIQCQKKAIQIDVSHNFLNMQIISLTIVIAYYNTNLYFHVKIYINDKV